MFGWAGKTLIVDLNMKAFNEQVLPPSFCHKWIGGKGFNYGLDALESSSGPGSRVGESIRLGVGTLVGTPIFGANTWCLEGKHPYTGEPITALGTGPLGLALKCAGFDQLVLKRAAGVPSVLIIDENGSKLEDFDPKLISPQVFKARYGSQAEVLVFQDGYLTGRGNIGGDIEDMGLLFRQINLKAIVIQGINTLKFANHDKVFKLSRQGVKRWRESGLSFGNNGCSVCHGRCSKLISWSADEATPPELQKLWLILGFCPQWMKSGLGPSLEEILLLLKWVTGVDYDLPTLFEVARKLPNP